MHDQAARARLIAKACTRPGPSASGQRRVRWTYEELAAEVGMSRSHAHAILAAADIKPHLTEYWVMSELSPAFDAQAAEVCGLHLDPPENTIVVSIDEKTGIQAKGLLREDTQAKPGRPGRRDNEYVRNGTQNLFAALAVHSGGVSAMPSKTRNREDLLAFLELLDQGIPKGRSVIAVTDNSRPAPPIRSRSGSQTIPAGASSSPRLTPPGCFYGVKGWAKSCLKRRRERWRLSERIASRLVLPSPILRSR